MEKRSSRASTGSMTATRQQVLLAETYHVLERGIPLRFGCKPMQALPVVANDLAQRIRGGQRHANAPRPIASCRLGIHEIMLVAKVQDLLSIDAQREYTENTHRRVSCAHRDPPHPRDRPSRVAVAL